MKNVSLFRCLRISPIPVLSLFLCVSVHSQQNILFTVSMEKPEKQVFQVVMNCRQVKTDTLLLKLPNWTPGYYQRMNYAGMLSGFSATDAAGKPLRWINVGDNGWKIAAKNVKEIIVKYSIKAPRSFVANPYLDSTRAYLVPAAMFLYPDQRLNTPVFIQVRTNQWKQIATGLDQVPGKSNLFSAPDFDILYDSPLLAGKLDSLPSFSVQGVPHRFIGYQLGDFDKKAFMEDIRKLVQVAVDIIGDIPFKHYSFIGIGPGQGGIEHLNSTTISFSGNPALSRESRLRVLNFIAHEYFHHYNAKRIRPLELGPFNYDDGNRTNLLWIAEGLTVYYEYLMVKRAGISTEEEILESLRGNILAYEGKPGRLYQSLTQASYQTWSDGPFGRTADEVNRTISYYDKGPVVGWMLDLAIRHHSQNKHSLDDVMRSLYRNWYQQLGRGFTDAEFRSLSEKMAGTSLTEIFEYTNTVRELDYVKYLGYAGLAIDTISKEVPGAWSGMTTRWRNDSLYIQQVEFDSPAWRAGLRGRYVILGLDGQKPSDGLPGKIMSTKKPGDKFVIQYTDGSSQVTTEVQTTRKMERSYKISRVANPDALQQQILTDWLD